MLLFVNVCPCHFGFGAILGVMEKNAAIVMARVLQRRALQRAGATVRTLGLDGVGVDGGVGAAGGPPRLQDVLADPAGDAGQLGGLQDEGLAVLGQQLGSALVAGERRHALHLLPRHVTARPRLLCDGGGKKKIRHQGKKKSLALCSTQQKGDDR